MSGKAEYIFGRDSHREPAPPPSPHLPDQSTPGSTSTEVDQGNYVHMTYDR